MPSALPFVTTPAADCGTGPNAREKAATLFTDQQRHTVEGNRSSAFQAGILFIATTGYTTAKRAMKSYTE